MSDGKSRSKRRNWKGESSQKPVHDETRKVRSDGVSRLYLDLERRISNITLKLHRSRLYASRREMVSEIFLSSLFVQIFFFLRTFETYYLFLINCKKSRYYYSLTKISVACYLLVRVENKYITLLIFRQTNRFSIYRCIDYKY